MRVNVPGIGANTSGPVLSRGKKIIRFILWLIIVAAIVFGIYLLLNRNKNNGTVVNPRTINQFESDASKSTQKLLDTSDYASYQSTQSGIVSLYVAEKDTADAQRVMDEVFSKVPSNKLNSTTYFALVKIDAAKNDTAKLKNDLKVLVSKLRAEGDTKGADAEQKYLDSLK